MGQLKERPGFTVNQYLALERKASERHEFLDGEIFAMAGESWNHGTISSNVGFVMLSQLKNKPCHTQMKDMKVRSGPTPVGENVSKGLFSYPDVLVVCDEPEFHDDKTDIVLNPTVIIEVLSKSTEAFDRGEKFTRYQLWNPTLTDYLLVAQDRLQIEHYARQANGEWSYKLHTGLKAIVTIKSIGCKMKLKDVYNRVKFKK